MMHYVTVDPHKHRSINVCVFSIQGGSNLGKECMAQLDVTANIVLPAITPPTHSWGKCVMAAVMDTHHFRHGQCGKSWRVNRNRNSEPWRAGEQTNAHEGCWKSAGGEHVQWLKREHEKHQRGYLFLSALLIPLSSSQPSPSTLYQHYSYKQPAATQTCC